MSKYVIYGSVFGVSVLIIALILILVFIVFKNDSPTTKLTPTQTITPPPVSPSVSPSPVIQETKEFVKIPISASSGSFIHNFENKFSETPTVTSLVSDNSNITLTNNSSIMTSTSISMNYEFKTFPLDVNNAIADSAGFGYTGIEYVNNSVYIVFSKSTGTNGDLYMVRSLDGYSAQSWSSLKVIISSGGINITGTPIIYESDATVYVFCPYSTGAGFKGVFSNDNFDTITAVSGSEVSTTWINYINIVKDPVIKGRVLAMYHEPIGNNIRLLVSIDHGQTFNTSISLGEVAFIPILKSNQFVTNNMISALTVNSAQDIVFRVSTNGGISFVSTGSIVQSVDTIIGIDFTCLSNGKVACVYILQNKEVYYSESNSTENWTTPIKINNTFTLNLVGVQIHEKNGVKWILVNEGAQSIYGTICTDGTVWSEYIIVTDVTGGIYNGISVLHNDKILLATVDTTVNYNSIPVSINATLDITGIIF